MRTYVTGPGKFRALASLNFAAGQLLTVAPEQAREVLPERLHKKFKIYKIGEDKPVGKLKKRDPAPLPKPKEAFTLLLSRLMEAFASTAPLNHLETVLERWVEKNINLESCRKAGTWNGKGWDEDAHLQLKLAQKIAVPLTISCRVSLAGSTRHIGLLFDAAVDHAYKPLIGRMKGGTV
ncbi:unnamed protein product [Effrenium voratum]|nr:unnamed protein product [Effrenium voratum]